MSHGWYRKLEELFEDLIVLAPAERESIIDRRCAGDERLREKLMSLLAAHATSSIGLPLMQWPEQAAASETPAPELPGPGDLVAHYAIIRELGRGGMGAVYLAHDTKLDRRVALKVLLGNEPEFGKRFMIEAKAVARCTHENVVAIHAAGEHEGNHYLVLEYYEGQTLKSWLDGRTLPLPPDLAVALLLPVVNALEYAHGQGIIHRDLKPENIMLTDSGDIKILDFGIAKILAVARAMTALAGPSPGSLAGTRKGVILGTMPYMSPEQWGADDIDHRSDLWAIGIMFYEMLVGSHPLAPVSVSKLLAVSDLDVPMPSARAANPSLGPISEIIDLCLIKPKRDRIASAGELRSRLEDLGFRHGKQGAPIETTLERRESEQMVSTIRESNGVRALAPRLTPTHTAGKEQAAGPVSLEQARNQRGARRNRGALLWAAAVAATLGTAAAGSLIVRNGGALQNVSGPPGTALPLASTDAPAAAPAATSTPDAGVEWGMTASGAYDGGPAPADSDQPAQTADGHGVDRPAEEDAADARTTPRRTYRRPRGTTAGEAGSEERAVPRESAPEPNDPFDTRN